jgi:rod shape-determining protein MreD
MNRFGIPGTVAKWALTFVAIVVIQGILAYRLRVFSFFDLPLIYCVYYGFSISRPAAAAMVGSVLGLLQDGLSAAALGTNGFSKTLVAFAAASTGLKFNVDQGITRIIGLILFTLADSLLVTILGVIMGTGAELLNGGRIGDVLLSGVFNTTLGLIMFGVHDRFGHAA